MDYRPWVHYGQVAISGAHYIIPETKARDVSKPRLKSSHASDEEAVRQRIYSSAFAGRLMAV